MSSFWLFHFDSIFRQFCLKLSVPKCDYDAAIKSRISSCGEAEEEAQDEYNIGPKKIKTDIYTTFDNCILLMICVSSIMLPLENPISDPNSQVVRFAKCANVVFTGFFLAELLIKTIARGVLYNELRSRASARKGLAEGEEW